MSLSFNFPGFQTTIGAAPRPASTAATGAAANEFGGAADLEALSEDEEEQPLDQDQDQRVQQLQQHQHQQHQRQQHQQSDAAAQVLPLLAALLSQRDVVALACTCTLFHDELTEDLWPALSMNCATPPASLVSTGSRRARARAAVSLNRISQQWGVLRKGWEVMLAGFEELWVASGGAGAVWAGGLQPALPGLAPPPPLPPTTTTPSKAYRLPSVSTAAFQQVLPLVTEDAPPLQAAPAAAAAPTPGAAAVDEPQQQRGGRQLQRVADKLASNDWQLAYASFSAALAARCDDITDQLVVWWRHNTQTADVPPMPATLPAVALTDCAAGLLQHAHHAAGEDAGGMAELLLAAEPELLLAATCRGPRPHAAILLARRVVLHVWPLFSRWLELVTARNSLLGERVHAARQLLVEPSTAALLPSMRNKGLLHFRGGVLLSYGLRRPLQHAALWLAAHVGAGRAGCSDDYDAALLTALRKMLTELDVADGEEEAGQHAKFRRCFSALLTHERGRSCVSESCQPAHGEHVGVWQQDE